MLRHNIKKEPEELTVAVGYDPTDDPDIGIFRRTANQEYLSFPLNCNSNFALRTETLFIMSEENL